MLSFLIQKVFTVISLHLPSLSKCLWEIREWNIYRGCLCNLQVIRDPTSTRGRQMYYSLLEHVTTLLTQGSSSQLRQQTDNSCFTSEWRMVGVGGVGGNRKLEGESCLPKMQTISGTTVHQDINFKPSYFLSSFNILHGRHCQLLFVSCNVWPKTRILSQNLNVDFIIYFKQFYIFSRLHWWIFLFSLEGRQVLIY